MSIEILLIATINFSLAYVLWFNLFRKYFYDSHRHELFRLRYELLAYAYEKNISFEHEAFKMRWEELNVMINSAHETHLIFLAGFFTKKKNAQKIKAFLETRDAITSSLGKENAVYFNQNRHEQYKLFVSYVVKSSAVLLFFSIITVGLVFILAFICFVWERRNILKKVKDHVDDVYNDYTYYSMNLT
jgi:hypothetical protein